MSAAQMKIEHLELVKLTTDRFGNTFGNDFGIRRNDAADRTLTETNTDSILFPVDLVLSKLLCTWYFVRYDKRVTVKRTSGLS